MRRCNGWRINHLPSPCSSASPPPLALLDFKGYNAVCLLNETQININQLKGKRKWSQSALTKDLYFNVPRLFNKFLDKQGSVPKSRQGFRVGPLVILLKFLTNKRNPYMSKLVQPFKRQSQQTNAFQMYGVVLFVLFRQLLFPFCT